MKHLDVYARRDPQLAPYLLREVDIEYKRKCQKVNFCFWLTIGVAVSLFNTALYCEQIAILIAYADSVHREDEAKDEDFAIRRRVFVEFMTLVKEAFHRDQKWTSADMRAAKNLLERVN